MLTQEEVSRRQQQSLALFNQAGLVITPAETERIEVADFGLGDFEHTGLGVLIYVNTQRVCAGAPMLTAHVSWITIFGRLMALLRERKLSLAEALRAISR